MEAARELLPWTSWERNSNQLISIPTFIINLVNLPTYRPTYHPSMSQPSPTPIEYTMLLSWISRLQSRPRPRPTILSVRLTFPPPSPFPLWFQLTPHQYCTYSPCVPFVLMRCDARFRLSYPPRTESGKQATATAVQLVFGI